VATVKRVQKLHKQEATLTSFLVPRRAPIHPPQSVLPIPELHPTTNLALDDTPALRDPNSTPPSHNLTAAPGVLPPKPPSLTSPLAAQLQEAALTLPALIPSANIDDTVYVFTSLPGVEDADEDGAIAAVNKQWHGAFGYGSTVDQLIPMI
jgi:hypothetical protein